MAAPEWTKKYREKGVYVGKDRTGYFLFRSHNEKDPITGKYKKVYDGYIGRITEKDGLIRSDPLEKIADYVLVEYGLSTFTLKYAKRMLLRSIFNNTLHKDLIIVATVLFFMYGTYNEALYSLSYLSVTYPNVDFTHITPTRHNSIVKLSQKLNDYLESFINNRDDYKTLIALLRLYLVYRKGTILVATSPSTKLKDLVNKYKLEVFYERNN